MRWTTATIVDSSEAYGWMMQYLQDNPDMEARSKKVHVQVGDEVGGAHQDFWEQYSKRASTHDVKSDKEKYKVGFRTSPGQTMPVRFVRKDGTTALVWVHQGSRQVGNGERAREEEFLKLSAKNPRCRLAGGHAKSVLLELVEGARDAHLAKSKDMTPIFYSNPSHWRVNQFVSLPSVWRCVSSSSSLSLSLFACTAW